MTTTEPLYTFIPNINDLVVDIQPDSITSRTFFKDDTGTAILFGFDKGQELTEHTSSKAAILHMIEGEATITLGEDTHKVAQGAWIHMPPHLKHSVYADTSLKMLLLMFDAERKTPKGQA